MERTGDVPLSGQVAIVTGAAQGLGRSMAVRFAAAGADIVAIDLDGDRLRDTSAAVLAEGRRCVAAVADVADRPAVDRAVAATMSEFGRIDILINNAGISKHDAFFDVTLDSWSRHLAVHLTGTFNLTQAVGREMAKRSYGRIVNISSVAGLMGPSSFSPYATVKAGIIGFTRAIAMDLVDHGITVNAIAPGPINTELLARLPRAALRERAEHLPVARLGEPEEIARAALFLASPDSGFITGTVLVVDGGSAAAGSYMVERYRERHSG